MLVSYVWFSIAALTRVAFGDFVSTNYQAYNDGEFGHRPHLEFRSSDEFSPALQVNTWNKNATSDAGSHIFLRHDGNKTLPLASPLILDASDLSAVYLNRSFENVFGTRVQENFGKRYLTFWAGKKGNGVGNGYGLVYDNTYRLAYKIWAKDMVEHSDLHEFEFTGHGTALVTAVERVSVSTSKWEGWVGLKVYPVLNAVFKEIDLETNEVLFSWRALDHIDPMDSFEPIGGNWDIYHMNSIQKTQAGNYLVSIRHIHSIILVDGKTGDIIWRLGGKRNDFVEIPPAEGVAPMADVLTMGWQHHARYVPGTNETEMTFFDNHGKVTTHGECSTDCSRGLHVAIDDSSSPPTIRLLREYHHPARLQAQSQGSVQVLSPRKDNIGNIMIGWGRCPTFTEHTSSGETVMNVQFSPWHSPQVPDALDNYRAYKMDWSATPWWDPAIALRNSSLGDVVAYVSWNGATEVREWLVRGSVENVKSTTGKAIVKSPRTGFETRLTLGKCELRYIWVEALDKQGNILRSTEAIDLRTANILIDDTANEEVDMSYQVKQEHSTASVAIMLPLGIALGSLSILVLVGTLLWRRGRDYSRLDKDDVEQDLDRDGDLRLGQAGVSNLDDGEDEEKRRLSCSSTSSSKSDNGS